MLLKLLFHGATYNNVHNSKDGVWVGIQQLNAYMQAKKDHVVELVKLNRHTKPCSSNRHFRCAQGGKA